MNALVQSWRDSYRAYDESPFLSELTQIPQLNNPKAFLDLSVLFSEVEPLALRELRHGEDAVLSRLPYDISRLETSKKLPILQEIPVLEARAADEAEPWCAKFTWRPPITATEQTALTIAESDDREIKSPTNSQRDVPLLLSCLFALLLGFDSAAFCWDESSNSFKIAREDLQIGRASHSASVPLLSMFIQYGTSFRRLRICQEFLLRNAPEHSALLIHAAVFLRDFLEACEGNVRAITSSVSSRSILYVWQQCASDGHALDLLGEIFELSSDASIETAMCKMSGERLVNRLEVKLRAQVTVDSTKDQVVREMLFQLMRPLFRDLSSRISLDPTDVPLARAFPTIVSSEERESVIAIERDIMFLRSHAQSEVSLTLRKMQSLRLNFTLFEAELEVLEGRIGNWLNPLQSSIQAPDDAAPAIRDLVLVLPPSSTIAGPASRQAIEEAISSSVNIIEKDVATTDEHADDLRTHLSRHSREPGCIDLDQCLRICLRLPLQLQASSIRNEVHDLLLHKLKLREHLSILRQVFFFKNGNFTIRLTNALFSNENSSIGLNHRRGRLKYWPPAASTVNFATRSLLLASMTRPYLIHNENPLVEKELLGHIGIVMSHEEETQEITRESLDALSFLHFNFRTPLSLQLIITSRSIQLYGMINQFLLMLLRIINVIERLRPESRQFRTLPRLPRNTEQFRIEACSFVQSFASHIFDTVIAGQIAKFETVLSRKDTSISQLRDAHISMLDHIMNCCCLGKKMGEIQAMLRLIFETILKFSYLPLSIRQDKHEDVQILYTILNSNIKKFVAVMAGVEATKMESYAAGFASRFLVTDYWQL